MTDTALTELTDLVQRWAADHHRHCINPSLDIMTRLAATLFPPIAVNRCLNCSSEILTADDPTFDSGECHVVMRCDDCDATWQETYHLADLAISSQAT